MGGHVGLGEGEKYVGGSRTSSARKKKDEGEKGKRWAKNWWGGGGGMGSSGWHGRVELVPAMPLFYKK